MYGDRTAWTDYSANIYLYDISTGSRPADNNTIASVNGRFLYEDKLPWTDDSKTGIGYFTDGFIYDLSYRRETH